MEHNATRSSETRLAELLARTHASRVHVWSARQTRELACAVIVAGDTFHVRRVLQRLERGELDVAAATHSIVAACIERVRQSVGRAPQPRLI